MRYIIGIGRCYLVPDWPTTTLGDAGLPTVLMPVKDQLLLPASRGGEFIDLLQFGYPGPDETTFAGIGYRLRGTAC